MQVIENLGMQFENHENHENHRIPCENHENCETHTIPLKNWIPYEMFEKMKIQKLHLRITKILKNVKFYNREYLKSWKSWNSISESRKSWILL